MTKRKTLLITLVTLILLLTGCGSSLKDDTIINDIKAGLESSLNEKETIDSVEITNRDTDKETKETTVFMTITSNDGMIEYVRHFVAWYSVNDDNEWYLIEIDKNKVSDWTTRPISGVTKDNILSSLIGEDIWCGDDCWEISTNNVKELEIVSQKTNLTEYTDEIKVEITLDSKLQNVTGEITVRYEFNERWRIKEVIQDNDFVGETKEEFSLKVSENDLKQLLTREGSVLITSSSNTQEITVSDTEISDFKINDIIITDKGERRKYKCTCTITEPLAILKLKLEFTYLFDDSEWYLFEPGIICETEIVSLNITGRWTGRYKGAGASGTSTLSIDSISEDGTIIGIYSYVPDSIDKYSNAGSYKVSGKIDTDTLYMNLIAEDWINEDSSPFMKTDIRANVFISDMKIEGLGQHGYPFTVTKE